MFRVMSNRLRHHREPTKNRRACNVSLLPTALDANGQPMPEIELYAPHHASKHPGYQLRYYNQTSQRMAAQQQKPKPPPYFCFTVPKFQMLPFLESLAGLLFANFFWVGLWDLLDNTIFPNDLAWQMYLLVIVGVLGLYFTNSCVPLPMSMTQFCDVGRLLRVLKFVCQKLYEPPAGRFPQPSRTQARELTQPEPDPAPPPPRVRWDGSVKQGARETKPGVGEQSGLLADNGDFVDEPFVPPRWEPRRFAERAIANVAAVVLWTGIWNQIDDNALPLICSYNACGNCTEYGTFPCAWYKIAFILVGLWGMYITRGLYCDHEVTYAVRRGRPRFCGCGKVAVARR